MRYAFAMPLPKTPPYGGAAIYQCDGYNCPSTCSVPTVTNDPAVLRRELPDGWMLRKNAARWEFFCPDCAPTHVEAPRE
jgi:hypothetical protein